MFGAAGESDDECFETFRDQWVQLDIRRALPTGLVFHSLTLETGAFDSYAPKVLKVSAGATPTSLVEVAPADTLSTLGA